MELHSDITLVILLIESSTDEYELVLLPRILSQVDTISKASEDFVL